MKNISLLILVVPIFFSTIASAKFRIPGNIELIAVEKKDESVCVAQLSKNVNKIEIVNSFGIKKSDLRKSLRVWDYYEGAATGIVLSLAAIGIFQPTSILGIAFIPGLAAYNPISIVGLQRLQRGKALDNLLAKKSEYQITKHRHDKLIDRISDLETHNNIACKLSDFYKKFPEIKG